VIDLRDNGGGLLDTAVDMLDRLLPGGVVVYTKDKQGNKKEYTSSDKESFDKPIAVLVNGNSASASEVFSGALQDYGAAVLVGTTTFGKGIVQSVFDLSDGTAVKLTTSKYYTPKGRNIHGTGLEPDIEVEYDEQLETTTQSGETIDNQMARAVEYLENK
jgi:carboxyl-terminal processing protease